MTVLRRSTAITGLCLAAAVLGAVGVSRADQTFPVDRELLLDARPMRPGKRMPSITVAANGSVAIDLWCKSVGGRVELGASSIAIVADALSEALPAMQSAGQCTPQRMRADEDLLAALARVTEWRLERDAVVLMGGPTPLRFRPAMN